MPESCGELVSVSYAKLLGVPIAYAPLVAQPANTHSAFLPHMKHILVVDHALELANLLADVLRTEQPKRFDVSVAYNGAQAIQAARLTRPDTVIMDIEMPVLDGFEAAKILRSTYRSPAVHLIGVSGNGAHIELIRRYESDFDHGMAKPIIFERLIALVDQGRAPGH